MGYTTVIPKDVKPSYYRLKDGTILKAFVNINYLLPNPLNANNFFVNSTNLVSTFVPKEKRSPELSKPVLNFDSSQDIIDEDVEFEVLNEDFSIYELSNGLILSLKCVLGQVKKTKHFSKEGEPIYTVSMNPIIKTKNIHP